MTAKILSYLYLLEYFRGCVVEILEEYLDWLLFSLFLNIRVMGIFRAQALLFLFVLITTTLMYSY